jgi:hypothetical protein
VDHQYLIRSIEDDELEQGIGPGGPSREVPRWVVIKRDPDDDVPNACAMSFGYPMPASGG